MYKPLFLTGTARGGTNLVKWILERSDKISLESEPYLPLYTSFRNAALEKFVKSKNIKFKNSSPIDDYYYEDLKIKIMEKIQKTGLTLNYKTKQNINLKKNISKRMKDYVPYLRKYVNFFNEKNYKKMFDVALDIVSKSNSYKKNSYIGWLDNWIIEFYPHLAKAYKKAIFIVIFRDVRASIASTLKRKDPQNAPSILSFIRCWRKQLAFAAHLKKNKSLKKKILFIKYEDLVKRPNVHTRKICKKLKIKYSSDMLDVKKFRPLGNDKNWRPNSNYKINKNYIYKSSINKWKKSLDKEMISFIELIAGNDLKLLGYKLNDPKNYMKINKKKVSYISKEINSRKGWSTDCFNLKENLEFEMLRNSYIQKEIKDKKIIKKFFLNKEIYKELLNKKNFFN